jgi:hypothetical protein
MHATPGGEGSWESVPEKSTRFVTVICLTPKKPSRRSNSSTHRFAVLLRFVAQRTRSLAKTSRAAWHARPQEIDEPSDAGDFGYCDGRTSMRAKRDSRRRFPQDLELDCGLKWIAASNKHMLSRRCSITFRRASWRILALAEEFRAGMDFPAHPMTGNRFATVNTSRTAQGFLVASYRKITNHVLLRMLPGYEVHRQDCFGRLRDPETNSPRRRFRPGATREGCPYCRAVVVPRNYYVTEQETPLLRRAQAETIRKMNRHPGRDSARPGASRSCLA